MLDAMSTTTKQERTELVEKAYDAWNDGDVDAFDEIYAEDVVHRVLDIDGRDELKAVVPVWFDAFPDLSHTVEAMVVEDEWVCTRFVISGTHEGEFQGIEPTGETFELVGIAMERVEDGNIVERWVVEDQLDLLQQLGTIESPG
jgi:steroid delta-isomerase-like uncharacterized protein